MFKINVFRLVVSALLVVLTSSPVLAGGKKRVPINLRFSGAFSNNVMHDPDAQGPAPPAFSALVHTLAKGAPGPAVIRGFGGVTTEGPIPNHCSLEDGTPGAEFIFAQNPLVIIFVRSNSLLFGSGPGSACVDFATGRSEFSFLMVINGGRGFFDGATGDLVVEGESEPAGFDPVAGPLNLNAETGTIKGVAILH